jgi:hypothetical protein
MKTSHKSDELKNKKKGGSNKSVVFCAIGEVFATGCFTFNYRQRYQEKITLFLPRATGSRSSSLYLSFENLTDCTKDD